MEIKEGIVMIAANSILGFSILIHLVHYLPQQSGSEGVYLIAESATISYSENHSCNYSFWNYYCCFTGCLN